MTYEEEKAQIKALTDQLYLKLKNQCKGIAIIGVDVTNRPGSFRGGEKACTIEFIQNPVTEGSLMDRLAMISAILKDVPTAYYPVVRESILMDERDRTEWELINEPNGVTLVQEEEEVTEAEIVPPTDGIITRVGKAFFKGLTDEG